MKTNFPLFMKAARLFLRIVPLLLVMLVCAQNGWAGSNKNDIFVRWKIDTSTSWDGNGGIVESSGVNVQNSHKISPAPNETATVTFTITPDSGYVIDSVQWKNDDDNGFSSGGTDLTPNSSNQVSITLNKKDASLQVIFKLDPNIAHQKIIAYYGSNAFDFTAGNAPNWIGGTVSINTRSDNSGTTYTGVGTSSYTVFDYGSSATEKKFKVTANTSPAYTVASVKYSEAQWNDPRAITQVGTTWTTLSPDSNGIYTMPVNQPSSYVIFVQFTAVGAQGGYIGAWYGTNNIIDYDTPNANGSGGTVWKTNPSPSEQFPNRQANGVHVNTNTTVTIQVRPDPTYKVVSIHYGGVAPINPVTLSADPTATQTFTFPVSGGSTYTIWVVFAPTLSSYTLSGTVDAATPAVCTSNSVTPTSKTVNVGATTTFTLATSSNCTVDCINFDGVGCITWAGGMTYTTPNMPAHDTNFVVRYKEVGYLIDAAVDASSPSGSGGISPATVGGVQVQVVQGASQTFTITTNSGYSIAHVYVTDPGKGWVNHDLAPMSGNTYTFTNVQANGSIKVYFVATVPASGLDYCQIPPFVQGRSDLIPNVMVIFDNSGSMGGNDLDGYAYYNRSGQSYNCDATHNGYTTDSPAVTHPCNSKFYGYFDPYKMYKIDTTNSNVYLIDNVTLNLSASNGKSGNYLNYRNMNKVDVIRKVLVGGRVTGKGTSTLAGSNRATIATKYLYTDNGKWVEYGTTEPQGLIQEYSDRVRFGLEVFGSTSSATGDGGTIVAGLGSSIATLVGAIEGPKTNPTTSTPIAEALYEAIRYYQAKPSAYNSNTNYGDAAWAPIIQYPCQRHFVMLLTDGEANSTDKLPGLTNPTLNGYSDGIFNVNTWKGRIGAADLPASNDGKYSAGVAYYGHVNDMRSTDLGNDMVGNQYITFYTVYAFGDGSGTSTLKAISKYGGFENKNGADAGTAPNKYASPDLVTEWDANSDSDPDTYYEGSDGDVIGAKLVDALKSIIAKVSSGTAASILANSEGSGANLLQAIFYPNKVFSSQTEANWTGELHNLWYFIDPFVSKSTVREDTDYVSGDHYLDLKIDNVVNYYFDGTKTAVTLSQDTNGDGTGDVQINTGVDPDDVKSIWRAGRQLWSRDAATRKIYTPCSLKNGSCLPCLSATCPNGYSNSGMMEFTTANTAVYANYLQTPDAATTSKIIDYVRGVDQPVGTSYRRRTVTLTSPSGTNVWKLGDIVSSTPRLESNLKLNTYDLVSAGYNDTSYGNAAQRKGFVYSSTYQNRGMVFVGANDGMLHAFNLGVLDVTANGDRKGKLSGSNLGEEAWAFIPGSALPYLKYMSDTAYGDGFHLNYVDGATTISDVSIGISDGCSETTDYWKCDRDLVNGTNWRTIVIGSMGTGGASRIKGDTTCNNCVNTPIVDPKDNTKGFGYSSYFALDVTDPAKPVFLWEFSDPSLGYATSGPAIMRLATTDATGVIDKNKNGRWFAVLASGPTGPISNKQFHGRSNQPLKLFILDLRSGQLLATIDKLADGTSLNNAFAGTITGNVIDSDRGVPASAGYYQDDVVYIGYTQANSATLDASTTWTNGGLLRLVSGEKLAANSALDTTNGWKLSKVIDGIGPVGSNIAKILDKAKNALWLYIGTGRYFDTGDDQTGQQRLLGLKEPCFKATVTHADGSVTKNDIDDNACTTKLLLSDLTNQTTTPTSTISSTSKGWYINLDLQSGLLDAERMLTDPVAMQNGVLFFTTFKPTSDVCSFGGETNIWATGYDSGAAPPAGRLTGKALLQLSTGSFTEVELSTAFSANDGRKTTSPMVGKPPGGGMPVISNSANTPVNKIIHVREK